MNLQQLRDLVDEVDGISFENQGRALLELRNALSAVIEHLYFRQEEKDREALWHEILKEPSR